MPAVRPPAVRLGASRPNATRWAAAAAVAPLSGCSAQGWAEGHWSEAAVVAAAVATLALTWMVAAHRYRAPARHVDRHVLVHLPMLAPERYCACGCCGQLAAPGAWLADWHYDVPGTLPPAKAPDAVAIQGLAWSLTADGWLPAIVYVLPPDAHPQPRGPAPSSNGQAHIAPGHGQTVT